MNDVIVINPTKQNMDKKIRVAAYVRVSSDSEDQENSFATQYDYYNSLISKNPQWCYVDIYADNGLTGTEASKRDEFNRMYADCADGKIDLILTKSISRFARNTYDCVNTVRKIKGLGANIIFEKENINTANMNSEVELAALASIAQEESMSLSKNVRMGIQYRMKKGTYKQGSMPFGYYSKNGEMKINEEQARVVKVIFNEYINGKSIHRIAKELTDAKIEDGKGYSVWTVKKVSYIIRNERYKGDALLQKSYIEDFPFKQKVNKGERDMYYVKNNNPAIVSPEIFDKANGLLDEQRQRYCTFKIAKEHVLSKKIYCEQCKGLYRRKSGKDNEYWICRNKSNDGDLCNSPQISEKVIYAGFVNVYNRLVNNIEYILTPMSTQLREYKIRKLRQMGEIENINKEIATLTEQLLIQEKARLAGYLDAGLFTEQSNIITAKISKLKKDKKAILGCDVCEKIIRKTDALISIVKMNGPIGQFDEQLFQTIVAKVWIGHDKRMSYELINGLKLSVNASEVM